MTTLRYSLYDLLQPSLPNLSWLSCSEPEVAEVTALWDLCTIDHPMVRQWESAVYASKVILMIESRRPLGGHEKSTKALSNEGVVISCEVQFYRSPDVLATMVYKRYN